MSSDHGSGKNRTTGLPGNKQQRMRFDSIKNKTAPSRNKCVHELFEVQVERTPDAIAVVFGAEQLTYRELNTRANQLAHYLRACGVCAEGLVGICVERSLQMIVGLLGILKAGGAYLPLDPSYPRERLSFMLGDGQVSVVLTQEHLREQVIAQDVETITLDGQWEAIARESDENPNNSSNTQNSAYVIYTSGSTGKPKGVIITHQNVVRLFTSTNQWFNFNERDVWTLFHSFAFDFSVWELWGALLYGGKLIVVPYVVSRSPEDFYQLLSDQQVTVLNQTPSAFRQLNDAEERSTGLNHLALRLVIFGGEALEPQTLRSWFERHGEMAPQLINMYGITETTVHVTYHPVTAAESVKASGSIIGRPINDLQVHVLDSYMQPVPQCVPGEMYVGGAGVSRGYLNRPELTAERFLSDPFSDDPGQRLYKTGDRVQLLPNGDLEYLGRIDQQVKIRGFRVELAEIEAALRQNPAVRECVVTVREDTPGNRRLVAYFVPHGEGVVDSEDETQGPIGTNRYKLPNGLVIAHLNKSETDFLYDEIFEQQVYLQHDITLNEGDCVFDVGANIGLFTLFVGQKFKNVRVYAFEPIPPLFKILRTNAPGSNSTLFNFGLADQKTSATFSYYPHASVMSGRFADSVEEKALVKSFLAHKDGATGGEAGPAGENLIDELLTERLTTESFTCELRTLSSVIAECGVKQIDLLKIDVEKSELDVLNGIGDQDWAKIRQIVIEVHDVDGRLQRIKSMLENHGYTLVVQQDRFLQGTAIYDVYAKRPAEIVATSRVEVPVSQAELAAGVGKFRHGQVSQWQAVFDGAYRAAAAAEPTFNIAGWNSSYTGRPIPAEEMQEWTDQTVGRILSLQPKRVLEIGCGTGLLLFRIAPHCEVYLGTDFSKTAIEQVQAQIAASPNLSHVKLAHREANDLSGFEPGSFDTVILNSVSQYFPNANYLFEVLSLALSLTKPGGSIFLGDVRSLPLLEAFHAAVEFHKASPSQPLEELRRRIIEQLEDENELVVDPKFFAAARKSLPGISGIWITPKRGRYRNEMTQFRYDAVLRVGGTAQPERDVEWLDWQTEILGLDSLRSLLEKKGPDVLGVRRVPNKQVEAACRTVSLLREGANFATAADLGADLAANESSTTSLDPEDLGILADETGYSAHLSWAETGDDGHFDVVFTKSPNFPFDLPAESAGGLKHWTKYTNRPGHKTLFLDLIPRLRDFLIGKLPDHMIPSAFVLLDKLPLTTNGKLDRARLPRPERARPAVEQEFVAPRNELEKLLAEIWTAVLGLERVGIYDDFFELGGHSLLATQVIYRIRERCETKLPLQSFFKAPTVAGLAAELRNSGKFVASVIPRQGLQSAPLSSGQQRLWFLNQLVPGTPVHNIPAAIRLTAEPNVAYLERSLNEIVRRHESLRTTIAEVDGTPVQQVANEFERKIPVVDLSGLPPTQRRAEARRITTEEAHLPFDLARGPLLRAVLIRLGSQDHVLLLTMHHIISDGWSLGILLRELGILYAAFANGQASPLAPLPIQYADFALWQREWLQGADLNTQLSYWTRQLAGAPQIIELPTDKPRPSVQTFSGARERLSLPAALASELKAFSRREGGTLFMTLLAAFNVLLHRYTGQEDILVGSPIASRPRTEVEGLIGFFLNNLVLRTKLSGQSSFREVFDCIKRTAIEAYANQDLPFERLVEELKPTRDLRRTPIFQIFFNLLKFTDDQITLLGLTEETISAAGVWSQSDEAWSQFDLTLYALERAEEVDLILVYSTDLFAPASIARLLRQFQVLLRHAVARPDEPISGLPLMTDPEREALVGDFKEDFEYA